MKDRLHWVPSFVTGAALATTATVAVALLLYSGEGMLKSLILIVAFELGALGLGLGITVPTTRGEALVSLRRRWLSVLVAFLAASIFVLAWLFNAGFGARAGTQALGLALLAGLPLYMGGQLLVAISADESGRGGGGVGAFATLGACAGVLVTGLSGLGRVGVPSLMFFMLMALSGAALVQGWLLRDEASPAVVGRESGAE
jgi:hypothetical protein